jgi:hypothetical protein
VKYHVQGCRMERVSEDVFGLEQERYVVDRERLPEKGQQNCQSQDRGRQCTSYCHSYRGRSVSIRPFQHLAAHICAPLGVCLGVRPSPPTLAQ